MIAGADRLGGASDDWKPIFDGIVGTIGAGMVVRDGQGSSTVSEDGVDATEAAEEGIGVSRRSWTSQASEIQTLRGLWHIAWA